MDALSFSYLMILSLMNKCRWEVSLPHAMKAIYSSSHGEGTDPRFLKLDPVFRGSKLKSGGIQRYSGCLFPFENVVL